MPTFTVSTAKLACIAFVLMLVGAGAAAAATLPELRDAWRAATTSDQFAKVSTALIGFRRAERFAKTAEVDYMIATSLCRVPGFWADGRRHFGWIRASYPVLGKEDLRKVRDEEARCAQRDVSAAPIRVAFAMVAGQGGASEVRSKVYYWIGRKDAAINTEPVEIVDPKKPEELLARLFLPSAREAALEATRTRLGARYRVVVTDNFILASASGHSEDTLKKIARKLERYMGFYVSAFRMRYPSHLVTVYLVPNIDAMRDLARTLHGIKVPRQSIGYAFRDDLSILGVIPGDGIGTLAHELFHVMVRDRYGDLPPWLDEGTSALYEVSIVSDGYLPRRRADTPPEGPPMIDGELAVRGTPNWRGCVVRELWIEEKGPVKVVRPTLSELVAMDWPTFNHLGGDELVAQQAMNHATARYFMLYLQEQGKLFDVFADFANRDPFKIEITPAEDARRRLAARVGDLAAADTRFEAWLRHRVSTERCQG